jgi:hypothetical protein
MRSLLTHARRAYGAHPLHLLALVACFALAGYVATHLAGDPLVVRMLIWFGGAVIGHDLVLFPLYALGDRSVRGVLRLLPTTRLNRAPVVSPLNYIRIPTLGTALLLVVFLPGIIQQGAHTYRSATGLTQAPYLGRWLVLTAVMFGVSAVVYAIRTGKAGAPERVVARRLRSLLAPGERVVTVGYRAQRVAAVVCTTHALHYLSDDEPPVWQRLDWADIADVDQRPGIPAIQVTCLAGAPMDRATIRLSDTGNVVRVAHDLIATTAVVTLATCVGTSQHAVITVRRRPDTDQLRWRVQLPGDVDPADHDVREQVDATIASIVDDLGLPSPLTKDGWPPSASCPVVPPTSACRAETVEPEVFGG